MGCDNEWPILEVLVSTDLLKSYLSCRQQQVPVNNISSDFTCSVINFGVPQGSI